ncbi:MAG: ABC transporter ATP-binding protein [Synergistaceae bacterium]|jgi:peptide/nickel transport system ATP-binding protein/oligopeptide transport system ATP-binding protein|nr:ABC transporter ATP-binding protein [Synergistaceae bacterium]
MTGESYIEVKELKKYFPVRKGLFKRVVGQVKAVDGVSFSMRRGETLGIVGESGCGKSTLGRAMIRLIDPTSGSVRFDGRDVGDMLRSGARKSLRRRMQIIFQDPYGSLNPRLTVKEIVGEGVRFHGLAQGRKALDSYVADILVKAGLLPEHRYRYPHEFSGGQRQRICIARAIAVRPEVIVCDEPVSALDVSIQSQVLNTLKDLQEQEKLTYLFITHDLSVVKFISDRVAIMYLGKVVETAPTAAVFENPLHPYAKALLASIPIPDPARRTEQVLLEGDIPSPVNPPSGCRFHTRCPQAERICSRAEPPMTEAWEGHSVACFLYGAGG